MVIGDIIVISILTLMVGSIILAMIKEKKGGKPSGCTGCPNYSSCRAHIGCANNPSYRANKE